MYVFMCPQPIIVKWQREEQLQRSATPTQTLTNYKMQQNFSVLETLER